MKVHLKSQTVLLLGLWLAATVAMGWFVRSPTLATMGDDSVSYLLMGQYFSPYLPHLPYIADWASYDAHFQPLFALLLALLGADHHLPLAHWVVAGCFGAALFACYQFVRQEFGTAPAQREALLVCGLWVLLPGTWLSSMGILSENLYIATSMTALWAYQRAQDRWGYVLAGVLLGAAFTTRTLAVALVLAIPMQAVLSQWQPQRRNLRQVGLMMLIALGLQLPWMLLRPQPTGEWTGYGYDAAAQTAYALVMQQPWQFLLLSLNSLFEGWLRLMALAPDRTGITLTLSALILLPTGMGLLHRLRRNQPDAWYVLLYLGVLLIWPYSAEARRLIYVVAPLLLFYLVHAAAVIHRLWPPLRLPVIQMLTAALCVPLALIAQLQLQTKALERQPVAEGIAYAHSLNYLADPWEQRARLVASNQINTLAGFTALQRLTETDARIMWLRPNYVAVLGKRYGLPLSHRWRQKELWQAMQKDRANYIVLARIAKTDLKAQSSERVTQMDDVAPVGDAVFVLNNPHDGGVDFVLVKIDPARLQAALGKTP